MEQTARIEHWVERRRAPRFRLGMPARLITLDKHLDVVLEDLSEAGAGITLPEPHVFPVCVLKWMDHHAFAEVRWMRDRMVGLQFASPIPAMTLDQTVRYAPGVVMRIKSAASELPRGGPAAAPQAWIQNADSAKRMSFHQSSVLRP